MKGRERRIIEYDNFYDLHRCIVLEKPKALKQLDTSIPFVVTNETSTRWELVDIFNKEWKIRKTRNTEKIKVKDVINLGYNKRNDIVPIVQVRDSIYKENEKIELPKDKKAQRLSSVGVRKIACASILYTKNNKVQLTNENGETLVLNTPKNASFKAQYNETRVMYEIVKANISSFMLIRRAVLVKGIWIHIYSRHQDPIELWDEIKEKKRSCVK